MTVKHKDHRENDDDGIGEQSEERTALTTDIFVDLLNDAKTTISEKKVFTTNYGSENQRFPVRLLLLHRRCPTNIC